MLNLMIKLECSLLHMMMYLRRKSIIHEKFIILKNNVNLEYGAKATLTYCCCMCKLAPLLWKTEWRFLRNLSIDLPYDPALPLLGIYSNEINI